MSHRNGAAGDGPEFQWTDRRARKVIWNNLDCLVDKEHIQKRHEEIKSHYKDCTLKLMEVFL